LALNDLATYYILANEDQNAATVFDEMYRRFPRGTYADRAAWKAGWWAYRAGDHREAARVFESAAVTFKRADYRQSWLYWAGRARAEVRQFEPAVEAYRTVVADYRNSYYGRLAARRIDELTPTIGRDLIATVSSRIRPTRTVAAGSPPPNARLVEQLLAAGLYDDAVAELRKSAGSPGASPFIDATIAYALNRKGELRPAITAMRRAYPEFMAEGGETLPTAILKVIFPLDYWALIRQQATARELDPYLVAALVAQESTFRADVRSAANAWGLMQILPSTGQRVARQIGLRPFSTRVLTNPETNVRLGTTYFADLLEDLGDPAFALAAYNAGPHRVTRWQAERRGLALDEFIDDIPFPETQNYVKRILGTADDYRILYGSSARP
jgi:soluble lytic murein transglycosylase